MVKGTALVVTILLATAMLGQSSSAQKNSSQHGDQTRSQQQSKSQNQQQKSLSSSDQSFLKALIQEDTSEIELAKTAIKKASSQDVKQYAATKILAADPQMRQGAKQLAQQYGVQIPKKLTPQQDTMHSRLSKKSGKLFDNAYMNYEASRQAADAKLVQTELNSTNNDQVKSYVKSQEKPVVDAASAAIQLSKQISTAMLHYRQPAMEASSK